MRGYVIQNVRRAISRYNPENDYDPKGPPVSYPEMCALEAVNELIQEVAELKEEIKSLREEIKK